MTPRLTNSNDPVVTRLLPYLARATDTASPVETVYPAIEAEIAGILDYRAGSDIPARELLVLAMQETTRRPLLKAAINGFRDLPG